MTAYQIGEQTMRYLILVLSMLLYPAISAQAQVTFGIGIEHRGVSIGFNLSSYPQMVRIPGYPVYYDPRVDSNYFFYDGLYWVYQDDNWYSSTWYDGPWDMIGPGYVPYWILRVPVRYYRRPPSYFRGWRTDAAPRWNEHWGRSWEQRRSGWNRWNRRSVPSAAPLPSYQRQYSGGRYPRAIEQQHTIQSRNYRYKPREALTRQIFQQRSQPARTSPQQRQQQQNRLQQLQQQRNQQSRQQQLKQQQEQKQQQARQQQQRQQQLNRQQQLKQQQEQKQQQARQQQQRQQQQNRQQQLKQQQEQKQQQTRQQQQQQQRQQPQMQQRSKPVPKGRGANDRGKSKDKGSKGRPEKDKNKKDKDKDGGGNLK